MFQGSGLCKIYGSKCHSDEYPNWKFFNQNRFDTDKWVIKKGEAYWVGFSNFIPVLLYFLVIFHSYWTLKTPKIKHQQTDCLVFSLLWLSRRIFLDSFIQYDIIGLHITLLVTRLNIICCNTVRAEKTIKRRLIAYWCCSVREPVGGERVISVIWSYSSTKKEWEL